MANKSEALRLFSQILLIRYFEEKIDWMFSRDMLPGTAHLCIGQEAVAVGAMAAINADDFAISTHRGHGHLLAKGADVKRLFCEIMGKEPGYCKGRGGTQHLCGMEFSFLGTNGITAGGIPIATGVGLALKLQKKKQVVLCFFGDGAANQGAFHESLNMASIWKVPVVYICENNLYAMSTPIQDAMNIKDIALRANSYGMPSCIVDGMQVLEVKEAVARSVRSAREGRGPTLIEAKTYRYCGHSKSDPRSYRSKDEEKKWEKHDPLELTQKLLMKNKVSEKEINSLKENTRGIIEEACNFAVSAEYAGDEALYPDEYL